MTAIEKLQWMIENCHEVCVSINAHRGNYLTVKRAFDEREPFLEDVAPEVRALCEKFDRIIVCQVYPRTPIGFVTGVHCVLETAIDLAYQQAGRELGVDLIAKGEWPT